MKKVVFTLQVAQSAQNAAAPTGGNAAAGVPPPTANAANTMGKTTATPATTTPPAGGMGSMMRRMAKALPAPLAATTGKHDVYFVFTNGKARPDQVLMSLVEVRFQSNPQTDAGSKTVTK
jgi:hypothetical protein